MAGRYIVFGHIYDGPGAEGNSRYIPDAQDFNAKSPEERDEYVRQSLHLHRFADILPGDGDGASSENRLIGTVWRFQNPNGIYEYFVRPVDLDTLYEFDKILLVDHTEYGFNIHKDDDQSIAAAERAFSDYTSEGWMQSGALLVTAEFDTTGSPGDGSPLRVFEVRCTDITLESLKEKITYIKHEEKGLNDVINGLKEEKSRLEAELEGIKNAIESLNTQKDALSKAAAYLNGKVRTFRQNMRRMEYDVDLEQLGLTPISEEIPANEEVCRRVDRIDSLSGLANEIAQSLKNRKEDPLTYDADVIHAFLGAMFTNQLIILSGPPGTGKSSLPPAIAEYIGAECRIVPVQPSWTDNQDLLGFYDPARGRFVPTPFLNILSEARKNKDKIYIVCLDEMNLVRVEYYFSEILSAMETGDKKLTLFGGAPKAALAKTASALFDQAPADCDNSDADEYVQNFGNGYSPDFYIPENVQFVGTLNMDETTRELSPKVLDRSFIIEMERADQPRGTRESAKGDAAQSQPADKKSYAYGAFKCLPDTDAEQTQKLMEMLYERLKKIEDLAQADRKRIAARISRRGERHIEDLIRRGVKLDYILSGKILPALKFNDAQADDIDKIVETLTDYASDFQGLTGDIGIDRTVRKLNDMYDSEMKELNFWR